MTDPFAKWPNDDLLTQPKDQEEFAKDFPDLARIFLWPELAETFQKFEILAKPARRASRFWGILAVTVGLLSLLVAALSPAVLAWIKAGGTQAHEAGADSLTAPIGLATVALALGSVLIGYLVLHGRAKRDWLLNRFKCERLRQLPFQVIANNLALSAEALADDASLASFRTIRAEALGEVHRLFADDHRTSAIFEATAEDVGDTQCWLDQRWNQPGKPPPASPHLDRLLKGLDMQRFQIQETFAQLKLAKGFHSVASRSNLIENLSNGLTAVLLLATVLSGWAYLTGRAADLLLTSLIAAGSGVASALIVAMRVLSDGLQLKADQERYRWYLAATKSLRTRVSTAPIAHKLYLLREMEELAYQEMRRFMVSASKSRFLM